MDPRAEQIHISGTPRAEQIDISGIPRAEQIHISGTLKFFLLFLS
jgi:hypothetical protein